MYILRATYDVASQPRGYIDLFLQAQEDGRGQFFTNQDLVIGCQVYYTSLYDARRTSNGVDILFLKAFCSQGGIS
jgi:hypothetical protein